VATADAGAKSGGAIAARLRDEWRPRAKEFRRGAHAFRQSPIAMAGLALIAAFVFMAVAAPVLAPAAPGTRNPQEMPLNLGEEWCPAAAAYDQTWQWVLEAQDPATHTYAIGLTLPPLEAGPHPRDVEFEVVALNASDAVIKDPPPRIGAVPPVVGTNWSVNGSYLETTRSTPTQTDRFAVRTDAPGNWTVSAAFSSPSYSANIVWHVAVPSASEDHPLVRVGFTRVELRPAGDHIFLEVHTARDCSNLVASADISAPIQVRYTLGGETITTALSYDMPGDFPLGRAVQATLHRPQYSFGTTRLGLDIYYGVVWGSQISIRIGLEVVFFSILLGVLLGLFAGYHGGWVDELLMRVTDVFFGIPSLILAMTVIVTIGPTLDNLVLSLVLVSWPGYARLIRGVSLTVKTNLYVEASKAGGARTGAILRKHVLPNAVSPIMVQSTLDIGSVVLTAAALSFIGFSFATAQTTEWGRMIQEGQRQFGASSFHVWWPVFYPGLFIFLFVLGFNMLGDGLRDVLDPRLRR